MAEWTGAGGDAAATAGPRAWSVRAMLAALVAACVLPAAIAAGALLFEDYRLHREKLYREELLLAQGAAGEIDRELARIGATLEALATSSELASGHLADFHQRASQALAVGLVDNFVLVGRDGRQLLNTLHAFGTPLPGAGPRPELARVFDRGEMTVTGLLGNGLFKESTISVAVPVWRDGKVAQALAVGLSPARVAGLLRRHALPENWVAAVVDGQGTIIARSLDNARFVGTPAQPALVEAIGSRREGVFDTRTREGFDVVTAFTRSSVSDWSVAVGAPQSEVMRQLHRSLAIAALGVAGAMAVGMGVALRWARRLTQSVQGLIGPAMALGRGELVAAPRTGLKEADAVGQVLEQASRMLAHAQHLAHTDALTGLSNRLLFEALAHRQLIDDQRNGHRRVLMALDLDGFKAVNDHHGHAVGDQVLKMAAQRIVASLRSADVPARLGGDEFVVLLSDSTPDGAAIVAEKLVRALSDPYPGVRQPVSASVGIAVAPAAGATVADLMRRADEALYEAKRAGKRRWAARA
ncbi:diguanylate cyclase [Aquincola sp. J276]|uniref:GGDEF domain-containing protein n=1 Tax=Aquincola sp. J276 TaxID=2898432 RepID=UPI002150C9D6|nr:sensor domain-containing diguanylate cyclase [Aquincola sp. J276]MCR5867971.1 sensor domain-containing diguanylate cyclase [Aquincola sp. J276]